MMGIIDPNWASIYIRDELKKKASSISYALNFFSKGLGKSLKLTPLK
jgi:hypothetical protein